MLITITVNGKNVTVPENVGLTYLNELGFFGDVVIYNGFPASENVELKNDDTLCFIKKGVKPLEDELEHYMVSRHTPFVYEKLKNSLVAVAGLGGLGSNIAVMLARLGVGKLFLVDFDVVEPSNLNRQSYYISDLGKFKTDAIKSQIENINPYIDVCVQNVKVDENNVCELFFEYDIVCEAFDNAESKAMLVNTLLTETDKTVVCGSGMAGFFDANDIKTVKKFDRLYVCGDEINEAKSGSGLMSPRVSVCAGHQANVILQLLLES